jgi:MoaA/NifB/PqqE/SkfB family radical SAM enzyme
MKDKIKEYTSLVKEKTGSSTFCILPWIHMATRPNGDMRLCCGANASGASQGNLTVGLVKKENGHPINFNKDTLSSAWNSEYMRSVRKMMLNNEIPSSCTKCFEEESNNVVSKRLWELYEWHNDGLDIEQLITSTDKDGTVPFNIPYFDLRLGHTCNLKCVMCSPHDSSSWIKEYPILIKNIKSKEIYKQINWTSNQFNNYWYESPKFCEELFSQIPNIRQLYFAGGEPLMIKEHKILLNEIINQGYNKNISLRYNSNGTFVDNDIIDLWSKFKQVRYAFSIDAIGEKNTYIRYPSNWASIEKSLALLDNTPDNIHCSIACTVQLLNIKHLPDFAKWKLQQNFKKINKYSIDEFEAGGGLINLHLLYLPTFLSARILPKEDKEEIRQIFMDFKQWLWDNYRQDDNFWKHNLYGWRRWEAILQFIESEDHSNLLVDFKEYISNIDSIRNVKSKTIFPELSHLL